MKRPFVSFHYEALFMFWSSGILLQSFIKVKIHEL